MIYRAPVWPALTTKDGIYSVRRDGSARLELYNPFADKSYDNLGPDRRTDQYYSHITAKDYLVNPNKNLVAIKLRSKSSEHPVALIKSIVNGKIEGGMNSSKSNIEWLSWSPDGSKLAISGSIIVALEINTNQLIHIANRGATNFGSRSNLPVIQWSKNGNILAFMSLTKEKPRETGFIDRELYVVDTESIPRSTELKSTIEKRVDLLGEIFSSVRYFALSNSGEHIAYCSDELVDEKYEWFDYDVKGKSTIKLSEDKPFDTTQLPSNGMWSPDDKYFVYADHDTTNTRRLVITRLEDRAYQYLLEPTNNAADKFFVPKTVFSWSNKGEAFAFQGWEYPKPTISTGKKIFLYDNDFTKKTTLSIDKIKYYDSNGGYYKPLDFSRFRWLN